MLPPVAEMAVDRPGNFVCARCDEVCTPPQYRSIFRLAGWICSPCHEIEEVALSVVGKES